jgi:hypothetical protein
MRGIPIAVGLLVFGIGFAEAQTRNTAYVCTGEVSGGLAYDDKARQWKGTAFSPDIKFMVRLKALRDYEDRYGQVTDYEVDITQMGTTSGANCRVRFGGDKTVKVYRGDDKVRCQYLTNEFILNVHTNRFLMLYPVGFTDREGISGIGGLPRITGGTCTKIE